MLPRRVTLPLPFAIWIHLQPLPNEPQPVPVRPRLPRFRGVPSVDYTHNLLQSSIGTTHLILNQMSVANLDVPLAPDVDVERITLPNEVVEVADLDWRDSVSKGKRRLSIA